MMESMLTQLETPSGYAATNLLMGNDSNNGTDRFVVSFQYDDWKWNVMPGGSCPATVVWDPIYHRCLTFGPPVNVGERVRGMNAIFYMDYVEEFRSRGCDDDNLGYVLSSTATGIKVAVHPAGTVADMSLAQTIVPERRRR